MPWPEDRQNRETLWNLLTYGSPEPRFIRYNDRDLVDVGPDLPKVPRPLNTYPDIPVTGGQELAQLVRKYTNFAPELKRHVKDLRYGPNEDVIQELTNSGFLASDYPRLNLLGLTSGKYDELNKRDVEAIDLTNPLLSPAKISINPRQAYEKDPVYTLEGTVGHELTHAMGANEKTARMTNSLLLGKPFPESKQAERSAGQSMPQFGPDPWNNIPDADSTDTDTDNDPWSAIPDADTDPGPQLNIPPLNIYDIARQKANPGVSPEVLAMRKKLGYGRADTDIFDYPKFAEGINEKVNQFTNFASKLPEGIREPVAQWGSLAGSGIDLIGAILADPTTAATSSSILRSLNRPKAPQVLPPANYPPAPLRLNANNPPARVGRLNPLPSNNYVVGEGGITVPQRKFGTLEPNLLAREGPELLDPNRPIGRPATDTSVALDTEHAAEQARLAGLRYTDAEQYPGTRFPVNLVDNTPPRFQSGDTGLGFNPQHNDSPTWGSVTLGASDEVVNPATGEIMADAVPGVQGEGWIPPTGEPLPYPLNVVPNLVRPRTAQENIGRLRPLGDAVEQVPPPTPSNTPPLMRDIPSELPPTPPPSGGIAPELMPKVDEFGRVVNDVPPSAASPAGNIPPTGTTPSNAAQAVPGPVKPPTPANPLPTLPLPNEKIHPIMRPYDAILTWARGQNAAKVRGMQAMEAFDDMVDPAQIHSFQSGSRQGRLGDVQKFLDNLFEKEKQAGLFDDASYRENYLRQYWDMDKSSPEAVKAFENRTISDRGAFTRDRTFDTYKQGVEAGMVPRYNTIAEIIGARTEESARALYNRELYNYLKTNNWLKSRINAKGEEIYGRIGAPAEWSITGPHNKEITRYLNNYLTKATPASQFIADMAAFAKNIYLSGGIPGTKYNIHAWNVARADAKIMGYGKGISEIFKDPTGNAAAKWFQELPMDQKALLPELMEHGYIFHPLEDVGSTGRMGTGSGALFGKRVEGVGGAHPFLERLPETGVLGSVRKGGIKATETVQDWFESPLFNKALPALKFKRAMDIFDGLKDKMPRDAALDAAARIANEYHGGIEKALRNKTEQNYMKFVLIAPDWAEAKIRQAINEYASFGGKRYQASGGAGRFVDISKDEARMKQKAFARGAGITGAGIVGSDLYFGDQGNNQTEFGGIPIPGSELILPEGAYLPTMGTFDESTRPLTLLNEMRKGYFGQPLVTEFGNRLNPIPRSIFNLGTNRNVFGGQLWGPNVPASKAAGNAINEATRPIQHATVMGVLQFLNSGMSWDDAVKAAATATESPVKFRKEAR